MGMPRNLFLVRHGQSEGNKVRREFEETSNESSFSDEFMNLHESQYALTALGIEQAEKAGRWFQKNNIISFDRMLVSNNVRAMQTAAYLNLPQALWMEDFNLRERDSGLFNVIKPSNKDLNYPNEQRFNDVQPFFFRPPQGESLADVCLRVKVVLDTLARECDGTNVIIVCHGHVMRVFRIILERMSLQRINEFLTTEEEWGRVPNCSIIHYTRSDPFDSEKELSSSFNLVRIIRPAGGGDLEDDFSEIERKKYSNQKLLAAARKNRNI
ncbi:MAG: phosphoglycerate mutase family protein [Candidatus Falkowbacteria bacterium]